MHEYMLDSPKHKRYSTCHCYRIDVIESLSVPRFQPNPRTGWESGVEFAHYY